MFMDESLVNISLGEEEEQEEKKEEKKDDQNENEFQQLVSYISKALNEKENLDPLLKIDHVIQSIKDFYMKDETKLKVWEDREDPNESKDKEKKSQIFTAYCNENAKKETEDSAEIEIKLIISRKKKTNSKKEKETKDQGQEDTSSVMNSVKKMKQSKKDQNSMGNFETDVKLLKGVFNYLLPLIMWDESLNKQIENENKIIKQLYFIVRTTRNVLCHWRCFFDETLFLQMRSNIKNLYDILGVDLNEKILQENLETDYNKKEANKINAKCYYYAPGGVKYPNDSKQIIEESRDTINREIKSLIMRGHSEGKVINSNSQSIILFGKLLHKLVGTRDTENWINITKYFAGYKIEPLKDGVNGANSADQNNFNIKSKHPEDFFFKAIKLKIHWAQMSLRYKDESVSNIGEISSALRPESTAQLGDLLREIISEKEKQLNDIINLFESPDQPGSAYKIGSADIDVFFKELIDCKQIAYISSADATTLSDNSQLTQDELKQRNERLTANSNRLILCPLKVQNQWFLFVADRKTNRCSLHGCLGNDSVSAPDVQTLCETFVTNLQKLPSLENLKNIPKGKYKDKKQPQKIVEDCGSFICSLAFYLVYCPLHLYPKDVRRIIMAKIL